MLVKGLEGADEDAAVLQDAPHPVVDVLQHLAALAHGLRAWGQPSVSAPNPPPRQSHPLPPPLLPLLHHSAMLPKSVPRTTALSSVEPPTSQNPSCLVCHHPALLPHSHAQFTLGVPYSNPSPPNSHPKSLSYSTLALWAPPFPLDN